MSKVKQLSTTEGHDRNALLDIHKRAVAKLQEFETAFEEQRHFVDVLEDALLIGYGWLQSDEPTLICGQSIGATEICLRAATVRNADTSWTCEPHTLPKTSSRASCGFPNSPSTNRRKARQTAPR